MLIHFKCDNCGQWHDLSEVSDLKLFMALILVQPFEPFSQREWIAILTTEIRRRNKTGGPHPA